MQFNPIKAKGFGNRSCICESLDDVGDIFLCHRAAFLTPGATKPVEP
jgi:hypothetical protein